MKKLLLIIALIIFILGYKTAYSQEFKTDLFSFKSLMSGWVLDKTSNNIIEISKTFTKGNSVDISIKARKDIDSQNKTAIEMKEHTLALVKTVNRQFIRFITSHRLNDLPLIGKVEETGVSWALVGKTNFAMSGLILMPLDSSIFPISCIVLTTREQGNIYNIFITVRATDVAMTEAMEREALRMIETFETFSYNKLMT